MKITGTIVNYYFHCKRQCWLFCNDLNMEDNSEDVRVGRILHEMQAQDKGSEVSIDNIKVDKLSDKYITEIKKSDADIEAATYQLKYYMYVLKQKGIVVDGKLQVMEKNKGDKKIYIVPNGDDIDEEINDICKQITELCTSDVPEPVKKKGCKKCAYYEFCFV